MNEQQGPPLTPVERAIIEYIGRGAPDAEIAARTGISIVDVKHKVEVLKQRFAVEERSALGAVDPDTPVRPLEAAAGVAPEVEPGPAAPVDDAEASGYHGGAGPGEHFTDDDGGEPPVHSRRAVLGALFAGGAAIAGAGAYYLLGGDQQRAPASRDPFATPTPTPTPAPAPTATPHPGLESLQPAPGTWTRLSYASGDVLDVHHGVGFIDTETGDIELYQPWQMEEPDARPGYLIRPDGLGGAAFTAGYTVSPGNTMLAVEHVGGARGWSSLYKRARGESYIWDAGSLSLSLLDDEVVILGHTDPAAALLRPPRPTGGFDVLDGALRKVSSFELRAAARVGVSMTLSGDRSHVLVTAGSELFMVELASGEAADVLLPEASDGRALHPAAAEATDGAAFRVLVQPVARDPSERPTIYELSVGPGGRVLDQRAIGPLRPRLPAQVSPDGRYRVQQGTLRTLLTHTGSQEDWLYTEVFDDQANASLFRVRSGHLWYGRFGRRRWLADSSAFIVEGVDTALEADASAPHRPRAYYLVQPGDGGVEIRTLALPPEAASLAGEARPEPAPDNADLVSLDGVLTWDRANGRVLGPAAPPQPLAMDPWGTTSREMRFILSPVERAAPGNPPTLLAPVLEFPPYSESLDFAVAGNADCLDFHSYPSAHARTVDCLPGGTVVSLNPLEEPPEPIPGYSGLPARAAAVHENPDDGIHYVRVTRDGRDHGWVDIRYLEWA